ncbi:hypothetical protein [Actinomadura fibrosa]|uniref:Peptidoglycan-binding protein n=1 Tax=Actinomadura fibrosa TaxID=111802 RepID=A0ABW2XHH6_9ACTN|nr:hypothetical protein [Actinomadura fibrosa]
MVLKINARAVTAELRVISTAMSEVTRLMGPQIWQGGSAASFTTDLQGHGRALNRMILDVERTVAYFNQTPSTYDVPEIPRATPAAGRPGIASVSPNGLERLETALTRAADRLPSSGKMIRGLLDLAYPDIPSTTACDRTAYWCHTEATRMRNRIMYALAENQANPTLLVRSPLTQVPDLERFGRKQMTELGRLQATALNNTLKSPSSFTPQFLTEMGRTLAANTKDDGYLTTFFGNVTPGSIGKLAYRLHQQHGGNALTPEDKKLLGEVGTALATLSRKKTGTAATTNALGPIGDDMPGQALLVKLSSPKVKWSSAVLTDMAKAALRWRQQYPSYAITEKMLVDKSSVTITVNQPDHPWWWDWGLEPPENVQDLKTFSTYDPALSVLGRISQQKDLTAARTLASTELEGAFTIKDAEKAKPLTWLTRGNGGTYASLLIAPDWPDGGTAAGRVIQLATTPEKGHEEQAAANAAEIMKTVAWWNDKGREAVNKLLTKDSPPDWLPWFDVIPRTDQAPEGTQHSKHYALELGSGLRTGLLDMTRTYLPAVAIAGLNDGGSKGAPDIDHATGATYIDIGGRDMQLFLRSLAMDDKAWTQLGLAAQAYRQQILAWGIKHDQLDDAITRAGRLEGNLISAYGQERTLHEELTLAQFEEAKKQFTMLRDVGSTILGSTPVGAVPGATDVYNKGTDLELDKIKYSDFQKRMDEIDGKYANYADQLYVDLALAIQLVKGTHTGDPELDKALTYSKKHGYENGDLKVAMRNFEFSKIDVKGGTGLSVVNHVELTADLNRPLPKKS